MKDIETAVRTRYGAASQKKEEALCCPVEYDPPYLKILPAEIIERDYGCGDPSRFVRAGETVLDLGSGGGKICYIASQIVGEKGRVIGVDANREMLALANKYLDEIAKKIGFANTEFRYGKIQDLRLNLSLVDEYLNDKPIKTANDFFNYESFTENIKREKPLVADDSVDVILSNCVLNLVKPEDKEQMFAEMFRVLKKGARTAVCDNTFQIYNREPYAKDIIRVEPIESVELENAKEFDCKRTAKRSPRETKGLEYDLTDLSGETCGEGGNCC